MAALNNVTAAFRGFLESVVIETSSSDTYSDDPATIGQVVYGSTTQRTVQAVVQSSNPDDLKVLDEGLRTIEGIKLHTTEELHTADEVGGHRPDVVIYEGARWTVHWVARRRIGGYNKAIALRTKV